MISRVANFTSSSRPAGDDRRPSITSESDWRVRIDAGSLFDMGASLLAPAATGAGFATPQRGCTPPNFPARLGLHRQNASSQAFLEVSTRVLRRPESHVGACLGGRGGIRTHG